MEYPSEAEGSTIACPQCGHQTTLVLPPIPTHESGSPVVTVESLNRAFVGVIAPPRVSFLYQLGLLVVAVAMVALPLVYLVLVVAAGWAVYYWATHFTFLLSTGGRGRAWLFMLACYLTPLFAGIVQVFFMVKPLFARRPPHAQPLALNAGAEPLLFAFVTKVCQTVGAPFPKRIDIDCRFNASASFRRGAFSFLGNDLVLTIGMPLVAGLSLREFAGVLAHEFGHFTQGFGMRLTYIIWTVNAWFERVVYERDAWDVMLEEAAETTDWRVSIVVGIARLGVWFSRQLLKLLMLIGRVIDCFMVRQMEYDADSYQSKLVGSATFETAMRRMGVLSATLKYAYKDLRTSWNMNKRVPDNFPAHFINYAVRMDPAMRTQLEDTMGLQPTGIFHTHPSPGDRIRRARQAGEPGVFHFDAPASVLFSNFEVPSKQVTLLHYQDDIGLPLEFAKLVPVEDANNPPTAETSPEANVDSPAPENPAPAAPMSSLRIKRPGSDET